jgi:6-phosphogluconolactonase (cycloisomerase 2 family)
MEMNERMSKRFWLLGLVGLVLVALLVACGSKYNSSSNGLLIVGSQGSSVLETFSFTLNNGHISSIQNSPNDTGNQTCILNGSPASIVITPSGSFAYVIFNASTQCPSATQFGIATFKVNSDGTVAQSGDLLIDPNPTFLSMDPAGKYLFVAEGDSSVAFANIQRDIAANVPPSCTQLTVCTYAIGSDGGLTAVTPTFTMPPTPRTPNFVALAPTPTVFPAIGINGVQNAVCSVANPPTSQFLYAVDSTNYLVWEFSVDQSTGALGNPVVGGLNSFGTNALPAGIAVDPCNRFVYVSSALDNKINAYQICTSLISGTCNSADGSLVTVPGSPFSMAGSVSEPGPLVVDPFGNNVYVIGTASNTLSAFKISPVSGGLTALTVATVATGSRPTSIAIRGDDNWMFVSNYNSATVSQYSITPATGALTAESPIGTDNLPWGVAVK